MHRRDWDLLEKQLGDFSSRSPENGLMQNGIIILMIVTTSVRHPSGFEHVRTPVRRRPAK